MKKLASVGQKTSLSSSKSKAKTANTGKKVKKAKVAALPVAKTLASTKAKITAKKSVKKTKTVKKAAFQEGYNTSPLEIALAAVAAMAINVGKTRH